MYIAPHILNVKIKNNSNEIVRGVELSYLKDVGRKARISRIKPKEDTSIIIVTKDISDENKFILRLRSGKIFEIHEEVMVNPVDYILEIEITEFNKENIEFRTNYIKYKNAIA